LKQSDNAATAGSDNENSTFRLCDEMPVTLNSFQPASLLPPNWKMEPHFMVQGSERVVAEAKTAIRLTE
jgi:hypothetical protein